MPALNENATPMSKFWPIGLAVSAGLVRLADNFLRVFNLSPVGAMGIFGGARLRGWQAYVLPLVIMAATDLCLWVFHGFDADYSLWHMSRPFVYGSFMIYVLIGRMLVNSNSPMRIGAASLVGSAQFFMITNFGAWLENPGLYARDWAGLVQCYAAGLPFADRTVLGDLLFTAVLFGLHALVSARQTEPASASAASA